MANAVLEKEEFDEKLPPNFYRCPRICGFTRETLADFCKTCEVKLAHEDFERRARKQLEKQTGESWRAYGFESLLETVYQIAAIAESEDSGWTVATARLVRIFKREEAVRLRAKNYKPPKTNTDGK